MNKEENFINTLFEKTEESEAIKPQTTEIIKMPMSSIVPNFKNPYKCREEDMHLSGKRDCWITMVRRYIQCG